MDDEPVLPSKRPADSEALDSERLNKRARTEVVDIADRVSVANNSHILPRFRSRRQISSGDQWNDPMSTIHVLQNSM